MRRVRAQIDRDMDRRIRAVAMASGWSKAQIVRMAIEKAPVPAGVLVGKQGPRGISLDVQVQESAVARLETMADRCHATKPATLIYCLNCFFGLGAGAEYLPASDRPSAPATEQASVAGWIREWLGEAGIPFLDDHSKSKEIVFQVPLCAGGSSPIRFSIREDGRVSGDIDSMEGLRTAVAQALAGQPLLLNATAIVHGAIAEVFLDARADVARLQHTLGFGITDPTSGRRVVVRSTDGFDLHPSTGDLSLSLDPRQASALRVTLQACRDWLQGGDNGALVAWVEEHYDEVEGRWFWLGPD